ncbi:MAG: prolipoprotein diacylglyceryl transferase [Actinomycetota bacterium]
MALLAYLGWKVIPRFKLGPISVSPHGIGIAVGYAAGGSLLARRAERLYGIAREHVWNMLMWAVAGVVVGARLFYIVGHLNLYFPHDPLGIFEIWQGGIVFYGGVFGGIAAAYPYMRKHHLRFWHVMDAAAPGFPLGLICGRIGDLIIGDHLGGPTRFFLGWRYKGGELPGCPPTGCPSIGTVVHQTALYDFINVIVLFPVVMLLARKRRPDGWLIMFTATWYAGARFFEDFARTGTATYLGLRGTQWVSVVIILAGTYYLMRLAKRGTITSPALAPEDSEEAAADMVSEGSPVERPAAATDDPSDKPPGG